MEFSFSWQKIWITLVRNFILHTELCVSIYFLYLLYQDNKRKIINIKQNFSVQLTF